MNWGCLGRGRGVHRPDPEPDPARGRRVPRRRGGASTATASWTCTSATGRPPRPGTSPSRRAVPDRLLTAVVGPSGVTYVDRSALLPDEDLATFSTDAEIYDASGDGELDIVRGLGTLGAATQAGVPPVPFKSRSAGAVQQRHRQHRTEVRRSDPGSGAESHDVRDLEHGDWRTPMSPGDFYFELDIGVALTGGTDRSRRSSSSEPGPMPLSRRAATSRRRGASRCGDGRALSVATLPRWASTNTEPARRGGRSSGALGGPRVPALARATAALRPTLPEGLELDTFEGEAWLGVVPFQMRATRFDWTPPMPTATDFPVLNLRTYVRRGDRRGAGSTASTRRPGSPFAARGSGSRCPTSTRAWRSIQAPRAAASGATTRRGSTAALRGELRSYARPAGPRRRGQGRSSTSDRAPALRPARPGCASRCGGGSARGHRPRPGRSSPPRWNSWTATCSGFSGRLRSGVVNGGANGAPGGALLVRGRRRRGARAGLSFAPSGVARRPCVLHRCAGHE